MEWRKATASGNGACVEVAADWHKASASNTGGCVEIKHLADAVLIRDSKDRGGPVLHFNQREWAAFIDGAKTGEFDLS
jgi:hypothetical protein